jgi:hypothetical protein
MTAKKRQGSGRVTPKGTQNPSKAKKGRRGETPEPEPTVNPGGDFGGKVGRQSGKVARPITHNRGNR